jgi:glycosyltransferase involved in cell wall biosynthesis
MNPGNQSAFEVGRERPFRLTVVETHPIQYKAPLFRKMAAHPALELKVLYAMVPEPAQQGSGFGVSFAWDIPLLEGYRYEVLENVAKRPSVADFLGCDTPGFRARWRDERPDAVLVNGWVTKTCLQALWACRRLGIPCLVRGEANLLRPRAVWKHVLHRLLLRHYDAFLAIGSANREFYRFHHCPAPRIFWAPYAVDNAFFVEQARARTGRRNELRREFGVRPGAVAFLFAGKLESKKHPTDIFKAAMGLPADLSARIHIIMAGDGPLRRECERLASEWGGSVCFTGFLNQTRLPDAYAAADVLVLPSDAGETWGLVVNEAMASGLPVIVSDRVGCQADLVEEGHTGSVFPCSDVAELGRKMVRMATDDALRQRMGAHARERIGAYSFESVTEGLITALCHVLKGKRARVGV